MKKKSILLLIFICIICVFALCSCNFNGGDVDKAVSIKLIGDSFDVEIGSFSYDNYELAVTYSSGKTSIVPLSNSILPDSELLKFYTYGSKTITLSFDSLTLDCNFNVTRKQIKDVYLEGFDYDSKNGTYNKIVQYSGEDYSLVVGGDVPAGATYSYPNGSSFKNVGSYDFVVYVSCDNYETKKMSGNITINKAVYDLSGVKFDGIEEGIRKDVTYDGKKHELMLTGKLPDGVSVKYEIQEAKSTETISDWPTDAGLYFIYAIFTGDELTHEPIKTQQVILAIEKKQVDLSGISFDDAEFEYDGKEHTIKLTNENLLTDKYGELINLVDFSYSNNVAKTVGEDIAKVNFYVKDSKNYSVVEYLTAHLTITPAKYDMSNVIFDSNSFVYDGTAHSIYISYEKDNAGNPIKLPNWIQVTYENNGQINAGTYAVTAKFLHNDDNYAPIPSMTANIRITKAAINVQSFSFDCGESVKYDGIVYQPKLATSVAGVDSSKVKYKYEYAAYEGKEYKTFETKECKEARDYTVTAMFYYLDDSVADDAEYICAIDDNHEIPENYSQSFKIIPRSISETQVKYDETTIFTYDRNSHKVPLVTYPYQFEETTKVEQTIKVVSSSDDNNKLDNGKMPGNYKQTTTITYFNGLELVTYTSVNEVLFSIVYEITPQDYTFENMDNIPYTGNDVHPVFTWVLNENYFATDPEKVSKAAERLKILNEDFGKITYKYKALDAEEGLYKEKCRVDVGVWNCKAEFSKYLTLKKADGSIDNSYVVAQMTINKTQIDYTNVLTFGLEGFDTAQAKFISTTPSSPYEVKEDSSTTTNYFEVCTQKYSFVYDGFSRSLSINDSLLKYGDFRFNYYFAYGDGTYESEKTIDSKDPSKNGKFLSSELNNFEFIKAGTYIIQIYFSPNANNPDYENCTYVSKNDLFVEIQINKLQFKASDYDTQPVKKYADATRYNISNIALCLNAVAYTYTYGTEEYIQPKAYKDAGDNNCYFVTVTLKIDTEDSSIDIQSFNNAVGQTYSEQKIVEVTTNATLEGTYKVYKIKIQIDYID